MARIASARIRIVANSLRYNWTKLYNDIFQLHRDRWIYSTQTANHNTRTFFFNLTRWRHWRYWPFVRRINRPPVNSPHKCQWRGALIFSLICAYKNLWINNLDAGHLRRHCAHYDVNVMNLCIYPVLCPKLTLIQPTWSAYPYNFVFLIWYPYSLVFLLSPWARYRYHLGGQNLVMFVMYTYTQCII